MKNLKRPYGIRAHHVMCFLYFEGKGYSSRFIRHMRRIKQTLEAENPYVLVRQKADTLCAYCPHGQSGLCDTPEKTERYDRRVLALCGLKEETVISWHTLTRLVRERVLQTGERPYICGDCEWNRICGAKEKTDPKKPCGEPVDVSKR